MAEQNGQEQSQKTFIVPLVVLAIVIAAAVVWRIAFYVPAAKEVAPSEPKIKPVLEANGLVSLPPSEEKPPKLISKEIASQPVIRAQVTLDEIIRARQSWEPAFTDWIGKQAPNFDLADTSGKNHKLSNYKGIPVILIFWATWCQPCKEEIPGLIKLRKEMPADKLAIIAVSYEKGSDVRSFLAQTPVNYTVIATPQTIMPPPYSQINGIPAAFFIDRGGIIRFATEGLVLPNETKLILKAID